MRTIWICFISLSLWTTVYGYSEILKQVETRPGNVNYSDLGEVFRAHASSLKECRNRFDPRDPAVKLKFIVKIDQNGNVLRAGLANVDKINKLERKCLVSTLKRITFPQTKNGKSAQITFKLAI